MLNERDKISIVVPVYNVEKYLLQCLYSISNQTYSNLEVVIVNDGSTDGSGAVCDEYASKDDRFRVLHVENGGVAKARQIGYEAADGEYLMFVDSDDWMPNDAVEILYGEFEADVDIVIGANTSFQESRNKRVVNGNNDGLYQGVDYLKNVLLNRIERVPWGRIYRRSLFSSESFPHIRRTQDVPMNVDVACRCRSAKVVPLQVYFYRKYSSTSSLKKFTHSEDHFNRLNMIIGEILKRNNRYEEVKKEYAMLAFKNYYRSLRLGFFDALNPEIIAEIELNIDRRKLSLIKKIYLRSFDSKLLRDCIKGLYSFVSMLRGSK
ncbi:MAG: glycosyltransferase family 2 protein [Rikenellaceae bacterium]